MTADEGMDALRINILLEPEDKGFSASVQQLPGVISQGDTVIETLENILEAFAASLAVYRKIGKPVPWVGTKTETIGNPNQGD